MTNATTKAATMTPKQWRMLEILGHWGGEGTMEVEIQWGGFDFGDSEADEAKGWRVNRLVVAGLVRNLVAKGFATNDDNGYGITEAGAALLATRAAAVVTVAEPEEEVAESVVAEEPVVAEVVAEVVADPGVDLVVVTEELAVAEAVVTPPVEVKSVKAEPSGIWALSMDATQAEAILRGEQTRAKKGWKTRQRGPMAIHAAKAKGQETGQVVGLVKLLDCVPSDEATGGFLWLFSAPRRIVPVPCKTIAGGFGRVVIPGTPAEDDD